MKRLATVFTLITTIVFFFHLPPVKSSQQSAQEQLAQAMRRVNRSLILDARDDTLLLLRDMKAGRNIDARTHARTRGKIISAIAHLDDVGVARALERALPDIASNTTPNIPPRAPRGSNVSGLL